MPELSINQIADLTGMDRTTVSKRLKNMEYRDGAKRARLYETRNALPVLYGLGVADGERLDPQQEKARLDKERRLIVELERQQKEGKLVDLDVVRDDWVASVNIAKGRLLALPSRLAPELVTLTDIRKTEDMMRAQLTEVLEELSDSYGSGS